MKTIAVIGLGLIGGSIIKGLKNSNYRVIGVSRTQSTIDKAIAEGLISPGSIEEADLIFICTPINKTIDTIKQTAKIAKPGAIITDVASIKGEIMDFVNSSPEPISFIGGHPMAGTEHKGLDASFETLYKGAKWVLTPSRWCSDTSLLEEIIVKLGAKPIIADPHKHDKAVALISHMPLFLSQALLNFVKDHPEADLAMELAASGFASMTRLAKTNPELATDMLSCNKLNIDSALKEFIEDLGKRREKYSNE